MSQRSRRGYTPEFKRQAIELSIEIGSVKKAARQLGVPEGNLHNWKHRQKIGSKSGTTFSNLEAQETPEQELKRLRKENEELKKVNYILKRAAAFFSQDHLK